MTTVIVDIVDKVFYCDTRATTTNYKGRFLGFGKAVSHYSYEDNFIKIWSRQHVEFTGSGCVEEIEYHITKYGSNKVKLGNHSLAAYCTRTSKFAFFGDWIEVGNRYKVSGSGRSVASRRLWANILPVDAIKSASRLDPYTCDTVVVHKLINKITGEQQ